MIELCACNGLPCDGVCKEKNYKRATRTIGPICKAAYRPERKKKFEQKKNRDV